MPEFIWIIIRSVISFFLLLALTRWMGKQQLSELSFFDYIVGITIGSMAASFAVDQNITMLNAAIGVLIWSVLAVLFAVLSKKSYIFRRIVNGEPIVLIRDGKVLEKNLSKVRLGLDDLNALLRKNNAFKLSDVEFAAMETTGQLSVLKKSDVQPLTPRDLGIPVVKEREPRLVIIDGHVMHRTLRNMGYDIPWLIKELRSRGIRDVRDVFAGQLDSEGNLYLDLYADQLDVPMLEKKPLVAASLKKVQADLESFALQTNDKQAKSMYEQQARHLKKLVDELAPYLRKN